MRSTLFCRSLTYNHGDNTIALRNHSLTGIKTIMKRMLLFLLVFSFFTGYVYANDCSNPYPVYCGECVVGSTVGEVHNHMYPATCPGAFNGPDVVFVLTISERSMVTITAESDETWDGDWTIYQDKGAGCPMATLIYCVDFNGIWNPTIPCGGLTSHTFGTNIHSFIAAPDDYYIWVDGYNSWDEGNFAMEITCDPFPTTTPTPADSNTPTNTPTPANTNTPTPTKTFTGTSIPTRTRYPTRTFTISPTKTPSPVYTSTFTASATSTPTLSSTQTLTLTNRPTNTPTIMYTYTHSPTHSADVPVISRNILIPILLTIGLLFFITFSRKRW